jgi:hypothetical protein
VFYRRQVPQPPTCSPEVFRDVCAPPKTVVVKHDLPFISGSAPFRTTRRPTDVAIRRQPEVDFHADQSRFGCLDNRLYALNMLRAEHRYAYDSARLTLSGTPLHLSPRCAATRKLSGGGHLMRAMTCFTPRFRLGVIGTAIGMM